MLGSKTLWGGLKQVLHSCRLPATSNGSSIGQLRWATHTSKLKTRRQKPYGIRSKRNSLPLIAQVNGIGPSLPEFEDVEQRLKEIDERLDRLKDSESHGDENYHVFVSDIKNQIHATYSKLKETVGDEHFEELNEALAEKTKLKKRFKSRRAEPRPTNDMDYGTPDPTVSMSEVPCHGCGALLHCQDQNIQGYIPSQKFIPLEREGLEKTLCQRCHLLKNHNICLNIRMDPKEFERIIQEIRPKVALVIVIVDLVDMPNSIIRNLLEMVGHKHHFYIVGNKVDLLPRDGQGFLDRVRRSLERSCADYGLNGKCVRHTCLVSAKTGYGIEELVTKLFSQWDRKGDVYLIGSTNVGKSSLFNAMLSSDYCRSRARELISRATTSTWPGTTLSLLKFPISRPSRKGLFNRTQRLINSRNEAAQEAKMARKEREVDKLPRTDRWKSLIGFIGTTVDYAPDVKPDASLDKGLHPSLVSFSMKDEELTPSEYDQDKLQQQLLRKRTEELYETSKWCFDTPGVIQPNQVINYLTQRELSNLILSKSLLIPRTFILHPGKTLFVGGLGRIDYLEGITYILLTVHSALPALFVSTDKANTFYEENVDTGQFKVPVRKSDRLPPLTGQDFDVTGINWKESAADVVLSSAGWVSVTTGFQRVAHLRCFTPGEKGLCIRKPALLPFAVNQRGKRAKGLPMYEIRE
ncbi:nitric oxide-associated protein 1-like [Lineus longissimus]|uniref:nitric oxide-associated protein 1-like n=1 Tax=Lineus longissimus TaxID=88925 RepID=UPI002B4EF5C3